MKLLCRKTAVRIPSIQRFANQSVRPLFCQPVMQPEHTRGPHAITTRTLRSSFKESSLTRARNSIMEPSYYDKVTGMDECDPRNYGYRVVAPGKRRGFTTAATAPAGHTSPFAKPPTHNLEDEYTFIMSSPCPVSAEQCAEHVLGRKDELPAESISQTSVTDVIFNSSLSLTEHATSGTDWANQGDIEDTSLDDLDLALE